MKLRLVINTWPDGSWGTATVQARHSEGAMYENVDLKAIGSNPCKLLDSMVSAYNANQELLRTLGSTESLHELPELLRRVHSTLKFVTEQTERLLPTENPEEQWEKQESIRNTELCQQVEWLTKENANLRQERNDALEEKGKALADRQELVNAKLSLGVELENARWDVEHQKRLPAKLSREDLIELIRRNLGWSRETAGNKIEKLFDALIGNPFDFGWALQMMRSGFKVRRESWHTEGRQIRIFLAPPPSSEDRLESDPTLPYLASRTDSGVVQPGWLPTQEDLLATDWQVLNFFGDEPV